MNDSVRTLGGIGNMAGERMELRGITTVREFNEYIRVTDTEELKKFIDVIALNNRGGECMEGYYPRVHNKRIKDGLIEYIREEKEGFEAVDYRTYRTPAANAGRLTLHCEKGKHRWDKYNERGDRPSRKTMEREGVAFRGIKGTGYRYGKSCKPDEELTEEQRDELLRNDDRYSSRREYECKCFRSRRTCEDFKEERGNRKGTKKGYCEWNNGRCMRK